MKALCRYPASPDFAEFLPAAIEIEATPPRPLGRAVLWTVLALCTAAVVWAGVSSVDVIAVAPGRLVPGGQVKRIQSRTGGMVTAIRAADGATVRAGQVLIELDPTLAEADLRRIAAEVEDSRQELVQQRHFVAAIGSDGLHAGARPSDDPVESPPALAATRRSMLAEAIAAHRGRLRQLDRSRVRLRADLQAAQEQLEKLRRTLPIIDERTAAMARLAASGLVARQGALELEEQHIAARQDLATQEARVRAMRAAIDELAEERHALQAEAMRAALARIAELETRIHGLRQEHLKAQRLASEVLLRAPVTGSMQQLAVHTLGGVVQAGETLAVVVPEGPALEVEALVLNRDIGFIAAGQTAAIKLDAYPFTRHGMLDARVSSVGADAMTHETLGPVYPVRLRIAANRIQVAQRTARLSSGMAASVEIRTGRRRVIDYLLSPLARAAGESLHER